MKWRPATVIELIEETAWARSIILDVPGWAPHLPGQCVDVRVPGLNEPSERSYAIASAPEDGYLVLTVERQADGTVSPYLLDQLVVGEQIEVRGPHGTFTWDETAVSPVLLIADGPGVVPFRSMLRHCIASSSATPIRLLYSARSLENVLYYDELMRLAAWDEIDIRFTLTHSWPPRWRGHRGPLDEALLQEVAWPLQDRPFNLLCGHGDFVDSAAAALARIGHCPERIKTERFDPAR